MCSFVYDFILIVKFIPALEYSGIFFFSEVLHLGVIYVINKYFIYQYSYLYLQSN